MPVSTPQHITQTSELPPAQPSYVLRGHTAQIHSLHFFRQNLRLLSGDADGWMVLWSVPIKRPVAVWQAHKGTVLGLGSWDDNRIVTHGRDQKLCVWQLRAEDEASLSHVLPVDDASCERKAPWLLHALHVNALNFCSFSMCHGKPSAGDEAQDHGILVAIPGVHDGHINVTSLPSEERFATIASPKDVQTGMLMATRLHYLNEHLLVLAGYESGHACIWKQNATTGRWETTYSYKAHSQPVLSLGLAPGLMSFYTSSADAILAMHPLVESGGETRTIQTKHAGQQSLTVRGDEKVLATAGWDGRVRVYSPKKVKEVAVLKWHKEGCYALAFAEIGSTASWNYGGGDRNEEEHSMARRDLTVSEQRAANAMTTHWLAAGSKDGKISLWDIY